MTVDDRGKAATSELRSRIASDIDVETALNSVTADRSPVPRFLIPVIATAVAAVLVVALAWTHIAPNTHPMPAGPYKPTPSATETSVRDLKFDILPNGAERMMPVTGKPQLMFRSWQRDFIELAIYPDGLVIWSNENGTRYSQLQLTPAGVASIFSTVTATGLFDQQDDGVGLAWPGPRSVLTINRGGQWVTVDWLKPRSPFRGPTVRATPSQARGMAVLARLFDDPTTWSLSNALYVDREVKPFWTSEYQVGYDQNTPDLNRLPSPVRELLTRIFREDCSTSAQSTRKLLEALVRAGYVPIGNDLQGAAFHVPGTPSGPTNHGQPSLLHVSPLLPNTCRYPQ